MLCVYKCRNELFHNGNSNFKNYEKLSSFLFDIIYLEQLVKYNEINIVTFFNRS